MSEGIKRLWVGIQGSPEYVEEFIKRLRCVTNITRQANPKPKENGEISISLTCYISHCLEEIDPRNLFEMLKAKEREVAELEIALGEREQEIEKLKEQLNQSKPKPYDVVLGRKH